MKDTNDQIIMNSVRNGDLKKLGILFKRYKIPLYNFFLRQGVNKQSSEDLVQEVFLRILKFRHTYRGESKFTTWLFQVARNVRFDFYRKSGRTEPWDNFSDLVDANPNPEELTAQRDEISLLRKALENISPEKREAIVLSRFHNFNYEEIAEITGTKLSTVKIRVFRGLKELAKAYQQLAGETQL